MGAVAYADQCSKTSKTPASAKQEPPEWRLPVVPRGMDVDATGVIVNAVVAVATLAAAIAAATAVRTTSFDRQQREHDKHVSARLTAAGVEPRLDAAHLKVEESILFATNAYQIMENWKVASLELIADVRRETTKTSDILRNVQFCTFDEIRTMVPLEGNCAMQIEAAQGRVRAAQADFLSANEYCAQVFEDIREQTQSNHSFSESDHEALQMLNKLSNDIAEDAGLVIKTACRTGLDRLVEAELLLLSAKMICANLSTVIDGFLNEARATA